MILFIFCFTCLSIFTFVLIIVSPDGVTLYEYLGILLVILFLSYQTIRLSIALGIKFNKSSIMTIGDLLTKVEKSQYKCTINYDEIASLKIIASVNNSRNKKIQGPWAAALPKKYFEFTLRNGKNERICINHYTKKQVLKILSYLNIAMELSGNPNTLDINEIMKNWYTYSGYEKFYKKDKNKSKRSK